MRLEFQLSRADCEEPLGCLAVVDRGVLSLRKLKLLYRSLSVALLACALAVGAISSAEARKDADRAVNLAAQQQMLAVRMVSETMLVALGVDGQANLEKLAKSRNLFQRTLKGLHAGDAELGLPGTDHPEILRNLSQVEEIWQQFDDPIKQALELGTVSDGQVKAVVRISSTLLNAMDHALQAYVIFGFGGKSFTLQTITIDVAGRQRMLGQRIFEEALLVTYGHDATQNRGRLEQSYSQYDRVLNGLLEGDAELRLVPAPTPEIMGQLRKVQRLWSKLRPLVESVAAGKEMDLAMIKKAARLTAHLDQTMNTAVLMYENM